MASRGGYALSSLQKEKHGKALKEDSKSEETIFRGLARQVEGTAKAREAQGI
jgi:hypothetical protein